MLIRKSYERCTFLKKKNLTASGYLLYVKLLNSLHRHVFIVLSTFFRTCAVNTITYTQDTCKDREVDLALRPSVIGDDGFQRYGCFKFSYKVSALPATGNLRCGFNVYANRHTLLRVSLTKKEELGKWYKKAVTVNKFWRRFVTPIVSFCVQLI